MTLKIKLPSQSQKKSPRQKQNHFRAPLSSPFSFPPSWSWLFDEAIPSYVKSEFSPRDHWKTKPFGKEDAFFFFKGIEELSDLFTEDRPKGMPAYFQHPKYRSSYLLYFLPLQAAKFLTLFQLHSQAFTAAIEHGRKNQTLKILDLGAGPGTGSISFLLALLDPKIFPGKDLPPIEFHWFDTNETIMKDGKVLIEQLASHFPKLREKVKVYLYPHVWWETPFKVQGEYSLTLMGNVLNESKAPQRDAPFFWQEMVQRSQGGGILWIEPAARKPSQVLSELRNTFFESGIIEKSQTQIWGPCLHADQCPLTSGRDWCHFSYPIQIPGKWFKQFSEALGSERTWVKFSYLWLASASYPAPTHSAQLRRVISDPLSKGGPKQSVLICEPETPGRWAISTRQVVRRGDLVKVRNFD